MNEIEESNPFFHCFFIVTTGSSVAVSIPVILRVFGFGFAIVAIVAIVIILGELPCLPHLCTAATS